MKYCKKCNKSFPDNQVFCSECGQMLAQNQVQPDTSPSECQITFIRPNGFQMMVNVFHIKVDNSVSYELKNGGETRITMSRGHHNIEVSVFGVPKKKKFNLQVSENMTLICKPNPTAAVTFFSEPVKVTDSNGREY